MVFLCLGDNAVWRTVMSKLPALTQAAFNEGKARNIVIEILKVSGDTPETRFDYITGVIMSIRGIGYEDARVCLNKKGHGAKTDGPTRTAEEEKDYGAARARWDSAKRAAGIAPSPAKSAARGALTPKGTGQDAGAQDAPLSIATLSIPRAKGVPDIATYALALTANMRKFRSVNSSRFTGEDGAFYRDTFDAFIASVEARNASVAE